MAALSMTYTIANGTTGDATQVNQNLIDLRDYVNNNTLRIDGANPMLAALLLSGDPTAAAHAVRKGYRDGPYVHAKTGTLPAWTTNVMQTCKFTTEVKDTDAAYNLSTGVFTAPRAGVYSVTCQFQWSTNPFLSSGYSVRTQIVAGANTYAGPSLTVATVDDPTDVAAAPYMPFVHHADVLVTAGQTIVPQLSIGLGLGASNVAGADYLEIAWLHA